jgi:hypothetical protein
MLGRRFLLLVAVLMGLTALAASLAPREQLVRDGDRRSGTPTPSATPSPAVDADRAPVAKTISTSEGPARVTVREGQVIELTVTGSEVDSVQVLDEIEPIEQDSPAIFDVFAEDVGEYPITLLDADRQIGTLVVRGSS